MRTNVTGAVCAVLLGPLLCEGAERAEFPKIYNSQEETIRFVPPEEALAGMELPEGFRATLFAAEPDVMQPIGMAFDSKGRLWVAENYTYAEVSLNFDRNLRDRIVILEDRDGDGRHDSRKVFWDGAEKLTSVAPGFGGVFAMCPPRLLFIPDADGDDVPDGEPVVLLDGFDDDRTRHTLANGLKWGPDGWLYGRQGIQMTSHIGKPGAGREERQAMNTGIWRWHPTDQIFEIVAQGTTNPWGSDWDEHGQMFFINTVIGHLWHVVPGAFYKRMYGEPFNPHLYELIDQTADHVHWDTRESWDDIRQGVTSTTLEAGGGHAHTALMMYLGDNWPERYRNTVFMLNYHGRKINNDRIERRGAGYVGRHGADFMRMNDPWFKGIELLTGPEGAVYVADWSDIGECHDNDGVHRTSGRIYRISHGEPARARSGGVAGLSERELVRAQLHRNDWYARQARQVLQERKARGEELAEAAREARRMFEEHPEVTRKLRALWCLWAVDAAPEEWLREQLGHREEQVRVWAIQLLTDRGAPSAAAAREFAAMAAKEESGLVLTWLASALRRLAPEDRWELGVALSRRVDFGEDPVFPLMVWYGMEGAVARNPERGAELVMESGIGKLRRFTARRVFSDLAGQPRGAEAMVGVIERVPPAGRLEVLRGMSEALEGVERAAVPAGWSAVAARWAASGEAGLLARELDGRFGNADSRVALARLAADRAADVEWRRRAARVLVQTRAEGAGELLRDLLRDERLAVEAIQGLAALGASGTAEGLLAEWEALGTDARRAALQTLLSRVEYARPLVRAVRGGEVPRGAVGAAEYRQLRSLGDAELSEWAVAIWPEFDSSPNEKREAMARYRALLREERIAGADLRKGREIYQLACASCHKLHGEGTELGPELTGADRRNLEYLLENLVTPSAVVPEMYRMAVVTLKDGRVLNGVVAGSSEQTLTIQTLTERVAVPREQVESFESSDLSLMPDGLLEGLEDEQVADLIGYLMSDGK